MIRNYIYDNGQLVSSEDISDTPEKAYYGRDGEAKFVDN